MTTDNEQTATPIWDGPTQPPMLYRGGLSGRVYVATVWENVNGIFEALQKFDVTDQFNALVTADLHAQNTPGRESEGKP